MAKKRSRQTEFGEKYGSRGDFCEFSGCCFKIEVLKDVCMVIETVQWMVRRWTVSGSRKCWYSGHTRAKGHRRGRDLPSAEWWGGESSTSDGKWWVWGWEGKWVPFWRLVPSPHSLQVSKVEASTERRSMERVCEMWGRGEDMEHLSWYWKGLNVHL